MLAFSFQLIISGVTLFGLLVSRPARRLGNISFGIYLLQGPVLAASFLVPGVRSAALASPLGHWVVMAVDAILLVLLSTATHAMIERPGVRLGKTAIAWMRRTLIQRVNLDRTAAPIAERPE
jgi:peptidoglycan/LPS O-acetylase OafA/YrhL